MEIFKYIEHLYTCCSTIQQVNMLSEKLYSAQKNFANIRKNELRICENDELNEIFKYDITKDSRIFDAYNESKMCE